MAQIFPKWTNTVPVKVMIALSLALGSVVLGVTYYATPKYLRVGYQPIQPVAFDHSLHVGQLGMDCRYCHSFVEHSGQANVPSAQACMNCHTQVWAESPKLAPVRESYQSGEPVPWVRVHNAPDYVYFNHAVHVNRGVSCVECHGQVNEMEVVYHAKAHSMAFCLECHRNPEHFVRPLDKVYDLDWKPESREEQIAMGERFVHDWKIQPPQSCSGCHR